MSVVELNSNQNSIDELLNDISSFVDVDSPVNTRVRAKGSPAQSSDAGSNSPSLVPHPPSGGKSSTIVSASHHVDIS